MLSFSILDVTRYFTSYLFNQPFLKSKISFPWASEKATRSCFCLVLLATPYFTLTAGACFSSVSAHHLHCVHTPASLVSVLRDLVFCSLQLNSLYIPLGYVCCLQLLGIRDRRHSILQLCNASAARMQYLEWVLITSYWWGLHWTSLSQWLSEFKLVHLSSPTEVLYILGDALFPHPCVILYVSVVCQYVSISGGTCWSAQMTVLICLPITIIFHLFVNKIFQNKKLW